MLRVFQQRLSTMMSQVSTVGETLQKELRKFMILHCQLQTPVCLLDSRLPLPGAALQACGLPCIA